jgi:hypothetical protein
VNDDLRNQIRRLDPMHPGVSVEPIDRDVLEDIMTTDLKETPQPTRGRWMAAAAVAAVALAVAVAIPALNNDDPTTAAAPLELTAAGGDIMASCLPVEAQYLAPMAMAFEATATGIDGEQVTLSVDRWFKGGEAQVVELHAESGMEALIAGFDFEEGQRYLISAENGQVNFCGFSGPATPELTAIFEAAFGA